MVLETLSLDAKSLYIRTVRRGNLPGRGQGEGEDTIQHVSDLGNPHLPPLDRKYTVSFDYFHLEEY